MSLRGIVSFLGNGLHHVSSEKFQFMSTDRVRLVLGYPSPTMARPGARLVSILVFGPEDEGFCLS